MVGIRNEDYFVREIAKAHDQIETLLEQAQNLGFDLEEIQRRASFRRMHK